MIKILFYGLSKNQGGIESYLFKISRNLNKNQFKLFFIDENDGQACFRMELEDLGAKFFDITHRRVSIRKNEKELNKLFGSNEFDILHFNCNTLSYITPIKYALKYNVKVLLHSRNSNAGRSKLTKALHEINKKRIEKMPLCRVAVSRLAGQWLFGKSEYQVLNNGIETEKYAFDIIKRNKLREMLGITEKTVYGNVAAFLEAKNHLFQIEIFKQISCLDNNSILLLVGDGELKKEIIDLVEKYNLQDKVRFLGIRNDIPELLMAMDCLIFPSLFEGFPNVILEAESTGLAIVMSDCITKEVVYRENCKSLSLEADPKEWAKVAMKMAISKRVDDRERAYWIAEKKGYSVKNEIERLENIYIDLIQKSTCA